MSVSIILGVMLVAGGVKGWIDNKLKPVRHPLREHAPVYTMTSR